MVQACSFRSVAGKRPFTPHSQIGRKSRSRGHCTSSKEISGVERFSIPGDKRLSTEC
jgi:hypothetical protein